jgi:hypothetical protein
MPPHILANLAKRIGPKVGAARFVTKSIPMFLADIPGADQVIAMSAMAGVVSANQPGDRNVRLNSNGLTTILSSKSGKGSLLW